MCRYSFENGGKDYCCSMGKKAEGMEERVGRVVDAWVVRCVGAGVMA